MAKKKFELIKDSDGNVDIDETLFNQRHIFVNGVINEEETERITQQLLVLAMINDNPIQMYVTCRGGSVSLGFAIIDMMQKIKPKVITIASGKVASTGSLISISGNERLCTRNTWFMFHDLSGSITDHSLKIRARAKYMEEVYHQIEDHILDNTDLDQEEIDLARTEELWIFADEAVDKGLVDAVI